MNIQSTAKISLSPSGRGQFGSCTRNHSEDTQLWRTHCQEEPLTEATATEDSRSHHGEQMLHKAGVGGEAYRNTNTIKININF